MMKVLPATWACVEIEHLLLLLANNNVLQQGWSPQCESEPATSDDEWGVLKTTAIQEGVFQPVHNKRLPRHFEPKPQIEVVPGDLLMTCAGPRSRCGVVCMVKQTRKQLLMSGKMYRFRVNPEILDSHYLESFLHSRSAKRAIDEMKTGINDSGLNLTHDRFKKLAVPVAPLPEQKRIVAKIEELISELDAGIESLKTAQAQLKVYRQSLLKHAFEGKLTAQWREQNKDKLESSEALLVRIQTERANRYQQQLKEWEAAGKLGNKPKAPKPLQPLTAEVLAELPELPEGWGWIKIESILEEGPTNGYSPQAVKFETGTRAITLTATTSGKFDGSHFKYIDEVIPSDSSLWLRSGDILVQRGNTIEYVGVPAIYKGPANQFIYPDLIMKIRVDQFVEADYILFSISEERARNYLRRKAVGAAGSMPKINHATLRSLPIPICASHEQQQIVQELETKFSETDHLDQALTTSLRQAEALRQSILKRAFSGQLVPQDPNDEPASALLARIKAEKAAQPKSRKVRV